MRNITRLRNKKAELEALKKLRYQQDIEFALTPIIDTCGNCNTVLEHTDYVMRTFTDPLSVSLCRFCFSPVV